MSPVRFFCDICDEEYDKDNSPTVSPFWWVGHYFCQPCADVGIRLAKERDDNLKDAIKAVRQSSAAPEKPAK